MLLIDRVCNRFLVPAFLVNSLPKSGTNLLQKAVGLFPGIASKGNLHIGHSTLALFKEKCGAGQGSKSVPIGVDWPQAVSLKAVQQALQTLKKGHFATGHIPFSGELASSLVGMGMKTVLILRDPRDVVVSHAKYVASTPNHFLYEKYQTLSESERILKSITGIEQADSEGSKLLSIHDRYQSVLSWTKQKFNYTTYFEKLVGPKAGISRDVQIKELRKIAEHLGIRYFPGHLEQIAEQTFGGTSTFRKGLVGDWQIHFSAEHKQVFKQVAGQMIIHLGYEENHYW